MTESARSLVNMVLIQAAVAREEILLFNSNTRLTLQVNKEP